MKGSLHFRKNNILFGTLLFLVASVCSAQSIGDGFYVGGGAGHTDQKDACDDIVGSCDETDTGWKLFIGYQFNPYISAEGGYVDLGESDASVTVLGIPISAEAEVDGFFLSGLLAWPINDTFSVFGKLGVIAWDVDVDASGGGVSVSDDESGTDALFGVGAQYDFTNNFGIRAEWERYNNIGDSDIGNTDIDFISGSIIFNF